MSESPNTQSKPKPKPRKAKVTTPMQFAVTYGIRKQNGRPDDKKVRRHARELGMGVGRGATYTLKAPDVRKLRKSLGV